MTLTTINLAALGQTINLTSEVTGTLPTANGGTALTSGFKNAGTYSLHAVADYTETDAYTTTVSSSEFTCTDQSCTLTSSGTSDVFLVHASLSAHSDADSNGYGIHMIHSTSSDFSTGNVTSLQSGRYSESLFTSEYKNMTGLATLTGLAAGAWYFRMFAMIQRPSSGTITLNQGTYGTSGNTRHGVIVQQYKVN